MNTASKASVERGQPDPHRALLPLGMRLVVRQRHRKAPHLLLDRVARVAGHHDHLVDTGAAQGDQLPADQRHALKPYQRLGHTAHAPAFTGSQQHRTDAQPRVQPAALFEQASHDRDSVRP